MTALETQSSRELFKGSTENKEGLRQRRDKEQMVRHQDFVSLTFSSPNIVKDLLLILAYSR